MVEMDQEGRTRFGAYLRSLRQARGLTQRQAGEAATVSCPYLTQLERGQRNPPSREILSRLARAYHVSEEKLLQEAGYVEGGVITVPEEIIERAFDFVSRDPKYSFGTRLRDNQLTTEAKAFIVEVYQEATGLLLLKPEVLNAVKEAAK